MAVSTGSVHMRANWGGRCWSWAGSNWFPLILTRPSATTCPGARPPVNFGRHEVATVLGPVTPWTLVDEKALRAECIDMFHVTDYLIPKLSATPVIATLMDAIPLPHPEWTTIRLAAPRRWPLRCSGTWAGRVISISDYSKREIVEHFGIAPERIFIVLPGVHPRFFERIDRDEVLKWLGLPA
ncbi:MULTISPECIES: glycosyltransferase [Burkholderia]|uniref:glycosyltransferase n=1 Tax=Burkholderia TaxID=32008 RepID=UPI001E5A797E|nr:MULTISPECIES: glycosyltransferase [Burkholderia]